MTFLQARISKIKLKWWWEMLCPHYHDDVVVWFRKLSSRLLKYLGILWKELGIFSSMNSLL